MGFISASIKKLLCDDILSGVGKSSIGALRVYLKQGLLYSLHVSSSDVYKYRKIVLPRLCKNIPMIQTNDLSDLANICDEPIFRMIRYKGIPIWIHAYIETENSDNRNYKREYISVYTINTEHAKKILHIFVTKVRILSDYEDEHERIPCNHINSFSGNDGCNYFVIPKDPRTINDVFMPDIDRKLIIDSIDKFKSSRQWYHDHGIPYHFGIMLYGPAGTGKSTIARTIADCVSSNIITLQKLSDLPKALTRERVTSGLVAMTSTHVNVLVEDVDCSGSSHDRNQHYNNTYFETESKESLGSILNAMDGICSPEGVVYIFTTNHIDQLDSALIRPGRIDLKINISYATPETLNDFCKKFYQQEIKDLENYEIKDDITFAELQTDVMRGMSMDDILEKCRKENDHEPEKEKE